MKTNAANAADYATKYRNQYWAKLEEALQRYWVNKVGLINRSQPSVTKFFDCWKGLTTAWDAAKNAAVADSSKLRHGDLKAFYDLAALDNVTNFNNRIMLEYKTAYWR